MPERQLKPISVVQRRARLERVRRIARRFGFVGHVEYRHVSTTSGGAQYGIGPVAREDVLTVYDKAFERDADPAEFSLEAIIAHERGHQLVLRHPYLSRWPAKLGMLASKEILASVAGSVIAQEKKDQDDLMYKAIAEATDRGMDMNHAVELLKNVRLYLEQIL